ncbi:hypothetical protein [Streptosporangium canum]|uniref:hypothetical protein n=1 Tax=Streptosporangium canum TaxID=324952 RepID=UPI0037A44F19
MEPVTRRSEYDGLKDVAQAASLSELDALTFLAGWAAHDPADALTTPRQAEHQRSTSVRANIGIRRSQR